MASLVTSSRLTRMQEAVAALFERNRQRGHAPWCGRDYDFCCPSTGTYPFQWFWDSCFHAIVLSRIDPARARSEIQSLIANAHPDGLISHVTFWQRERYEQMLETYSIAYRTPYLTDCIQPPLLAEAVAAAAHRGGGTAFVREVMPALRRYYDYLNRVRDPDRDGLIAILQADESGLDHSPKYDRYLGIESIAPAEMTRGWQRVATAYAGVDRVPERMFALDRFIVEDVMVNTIYAINLRQLADLYRELGDPTAAAEMDGRAARTRAGLLDKCYSETDGLFYDLAGQREERLRTSTATALLPLALPDLPAPMAAALIAHLRDPEEYAAEYPVPSVSMREPAFCPEMPAGNLVFRGTTWLNLNWYLCRGLRRHGATDLARRVEERSVALVERAGFRECYNPRTGAGYGAQGLGWSALALELLAALEGEQGAAAPGSVV
ncbi:MAG: hypothetical protein JXR83_06800 [Deltaproteobacteria bacterium]|nr:hypothetical protein [Deltaproteobacteria bacterium]